MTPLNLESINTLKKLICPTYAQKFEGLLLTGGSQNPMTNEFTAENIAKLKRAVADFCGNTDAKRPTQWAALNPILGTKRLEVCFSDGSILVLKLDDMIDHTNKERG